MMCCRGQVCRASSAVRALDRAVGALATPGRQAGPDLAQGRHSTPVGLVSPFRLQEFRRFPIRKYHSVRPLARVPRRLAELVLGPSESAIIETAREEVGHAFRSAIVEQYLKSYKDFPPSQRPSSFTIDQAMEKLKQGFGK